MKAEITKYKQPPRQGGQVEVKSPGMGNHANPIDVIARFWRAKESELPQFATVLRAVLAHSPNSVPPERVFSILNDSFGRSETTKRRRARTTSS
eukprot:scaffold17869_cov29-Tisochrysis_lutea.AAC.4